MRETPEEMAELQALLDHSVRSSNEHLTNIVKPERRLSAAQTVTALTGMKVLVIATVTRGGEPRTSCVDGHFLHGRWLFSTSGASAKATHLRERPAVSVTHVDGERLAVFTHGVAEYVTAGHPDFAGYDEYFTAHYGSSPTSWGPDIVFLRLQPSWMVSFAMNAAEFPAA